MVAKTAAAAAPIRRSFTTYVEDRERMTKQAFSAIQKEGPAAAFETCRVLAQEIDAGLWDKQPEHFCNILWLAEFQVSLERAAFVLDENIRQAANGSGTSPGTINEVDDIRQVSSVEDERRDVHDGIDLHPSRRYASRLPGVR